jgi:hypothetical protein
VFATISLQVLQFHAITHPVAQQDPAIHPIFSSFRTLSVVTGVDPQETRLGVKDYLWYSSALRCAREGRDCNVKSVGDLLMDNQLAQLTVDSLALVGHSVL